MRTDPTLKGDVAVKQKPRKLLILRKRVDLHVEDQY